jgi:hypothetical protein
MENWEFYNKEVYTYTHLYKKLLHDNEYKNNNNNNSEPIFLANFIISYRWFCHTYRKQYSHVRLVAQYLLLIY